MQYINNSFHCTNQEYDDLINDVNKTFINCDFILDVIDQQKQIEYITNTSKIIGCKKIYKQPSTNSLTTSKFLVPININGIQFDGSQNIQVPSDIQPASIGNFMVSNGSQWTSQNKIELGIQYINNGIDDISLLSATHSLIDRRFFITFQPGAAYHIQSKYFLVNNTQIPIILQSPQHADITGQYYCYFNNEGNIQVSANFWDIDVSVPLYSVYYTTNNQGNGNIKDSILQKETHQSINGMDNSTRKYLHSLVGTQLQSGCVLTQGTGISWSATQGIIVNEDLNTIVQMAPTQPTLQYRLVWLTGSDNSPSWNWVDIAQNGVNTNGTNAYYNQLNGSTWQLTPITEQKKFFNQWVIATNAYNGPQLIVVMSQQTYDSISNAQNETFGNIKHFNLFTVESVILYKITYRRVNQNPSQQFYLDIQQITKIQQNIIEVEQQIIQKQQIQQTQIQTYLLSINIDTFQDVLSLIIVQSGKYNISYFCSWIRENTVNYDIYINVYINDVRQHSLQGYSENKNGSLSNQYVLDLLTNDILELRIKQVGYDTCSGFTIKNANLQIIQIF